VKRCITIAAAIAALAIPATASAEYSAPDQIPQSAQCGSGAFGAFADKEDVRHDSAAIPTLAKRKAPPVSSGSSALA
jgi:hypothetical protein